MGGTMAVGHEPCRPCPSMDRFAVPRTISQEREDMDPNLTVGLIGAGIGTLPVLIVVIAAIYKRGRKDQALKGEIEQLKSELAHRPDFEGVNNKIAGLATKEELLQRTEQLWNEVSKSPTGSHKIFSHTLEKLDREINELHEKVNHGLAMGVERGSASERRILDQIAQLRADVEVLRHGSSMVVDALNDVEKSVAQLLKNAEADGVRLKGLDKAHDQLEQRIRQLERELSALAAKVQERRQ